MKEIEFIQHEIDKKSTGVFKDTFEHICYLVNGEFHREDGPALIYDDGEEIYIYYKNEAESREQFYDPEWRKRVEINRFL